MELEHAMYKQIQLRPANSKRMSTSHTLPPNSWSLAYRQDLGITQAGRQLRYEYSLIYQTHYDMYISLRDLIEYVKSLESHQDIVIPRGATIGLKTWDTTYYERWEALDLLPCLCALKRSPTTTINLEDAHARNVDTNYVQSLITVHGNPAWAACFEQELEHVWIYPDYHDNYAKVYLDIKPEYIDGNLLGPGVDTSLEHRRWCPGSTFICAQKSWLKKVGLQDLEGWERLGLCADLLTQ